MSNVIINKKPFPKTEYYDGNYIADVSDTDDEAKIRQFEFTLEVSSDLDNDMMEVIGITWLDEIPPAHEIAEDRIKEKFYDQLF